MQVTATSNDIYFGSRRLAVMDQLGSVVKATSPVVSYFPWGETKGASNPQDTWNFATYWQDSTTSLDYANNRYYSNIGGRFMTPDPSASSEDPRSPQSWNRFPYVQGDPVNRNDPSGLVSICPGGVDVVWDSGGGDDGSFGGASCGGFGWGGFCDASQGSCDTFGLSSFCQALIMANNLSGLAINSNCATPGAAPVPVGVVDCIDAINKLWAAEQLVARRLAEIAANGGRPDPGHVASLQGALTQLENAYAQVVKYCSNYVGAALAIEGAVILIDAATAVLIAAGA
jgi:RHS repeat-associated protein